MSKFVRIIGFSWASPMTLLGLLYVVLFSALRWYRYAGQNGDALVWEVDHDKTPMWVCRSILFHGGHAIGNVVVTSACVDTVAGRLVLKHELEHVRQFMTLGVFQPMLYVLGWLLVKLTCPRANAFYSNPMEAEARRAAGQLVDVEGALERLRLQSKKKHVS